MELIVWKKEYKILSIFAIGVRNKSQKMTVYGKYAKVRIAERVLE